MGGIARILLTLAGLNLDLLSGTCVGECFAKRNSTITCDAGAFTIEGIISMMHCAYKCYRDKACMVFQHSKTMRICQGCMVYRDYKKVVLDSPSDIASYIRNPTGSPNDDRDAFCLTPCEADLKPACQEITMNFEVLKNASCFETCKQLPGFRYYAAIVREIYTHFFMPSKCLCGYNGKVGNSSDQCSQVCPKGDDACDEKTVYKYRFGC